MFGFFYFLLTFLSLHTAIGGDSLYFSEREMVHLATYHAILTFFFTISCFVIIQSKHLPLSKIKENLQLILSLILLLFVLGVSSFFSTFTFHTLVSFAFRTQFVIIQISLLFLVLYMTMGWIILIGDFTNLNKTVKKQQEV